MKNLTTFSEDTPDVLLWQLTLKGDQKALGVLYDRYYLVLLNFGLRFSDDRESVRSQNKKPEHSYTEQGLARQRIHSGELHQK